MQPRGPTCHGWRAPQYRPVRPFAAENRYAQLLNALALARDGITPGVLDSPPCGSGLPAMAGASLPSDRIVAAVQCGRRGERLPRGRGDALDDRPDRLVGDAVREGEVAQALVARPRGDLGPTCRRELRTVLGRRCLLGRVWAVRQGAADGEAGGEEGRIIVHVRATGEFTHAYPTPVTSASTCKVRWFVLRAIERENAASSGLGFTAKTRSSLMTTCASSMGTSRARAARRSSGSTTASNIDQFATSAGIIDRSPCSQALTVHHNQVSTFRGNEVPPKVAGRLMVHLQALVAAR